jgi:hypothetical protein
MICIKKIIFLFLFFNIATLASTQAQTRLATSPCEIWGVIYVQPIKQRATFFVYVEKDEFLADIRVFKEDNKLNANKAGIWYFVDNEGFSDFSIHFVEDKAQADFSIYYTENEFFAGCVR